MARYVEIHILQTLPPACLNRDRDNQPKTVRYGGWTRMRVSSQAWKRACRQAFNERLKPEQLGKRSREFTGMILDRLPEDKRGHERTVDACRQLIATLGIPEDADRPGQTAAVQFIGERQWQRFADLIAETLDEEDPIQAVKDRKKQARDIFVDEHSVDVALFGRMSAGDDTEANRVDAACQVAHAIGITPSDIEYDFYTAIDDHSGQAIEPENDGTSTGAAHLSSTGYTTSTVYRYACIDVDQLARNLAGDTDALRQAIAAFLDAFATSMPTGKQNAFAAFTLPDFTAIDIRDDRPVNLAAAFEQPIRRDTIPTATRRLLEQCDDYLNTFGLHEPAMWITATRQAMQGLDEDQQDMPIPLPDAIREAADRAVEA